MVAPAATNSASEIEAASPAPVSTKTSIPNRSNSRTPSGVSETRPSMVLISLGTPTVFTPRATLLVAIPHV